MYLVKTEPPARAGDAEKKDDLSAIKQVVRVGARVHVENGMHEILVPAKVLAVDEKGFTVEHKGRKTVSLWPNAGFVKDGRGLLLFDSEHCYTHVV